MHKSLYEGKLFMTLKDKYIFPFIQTYLNEHIHGTSIQVYSIFEDMTVMFDPDAVWSEYFHIGASLLKQYYGVSVIYIHINEISSFNFLDILLRAA